MEKKTGMVLGILLGLLLDLFGGKIIGVSSIMFVIVVILARLYDKNFSKDSRMTIMLMIASTTIIYETGLYIFNIIKLSIPLELMQFMKILIIEVIYNTILTIILYPIIQKAGSFLEKSFNEPKVLTRYF